MAPGDRRRRRGRRGRASDAGDRWDDDAIADEVLAIEAIDLHGRRSDEALHLVELAVHRARVRGHTQVRVVTGRGWGNQRHEPVLRTRIEEWTRSADARARGVLGFERTDRDGALLLRLKPRA